MKTFYTVNELKQELSKVARADVGFVPTMGALHAGHRSLVEKARRECKVVVVSVFVNPTQFNDKNDLRNYPRTPEEDAAMLEAAGADYVLMCYTPRSLQWRGTGGEPSVRHSKPREGILRREGFSADCSNQGYGEAAQPGC